MNGASVFPAKEILFASLWTVLRASRFQLSQGFITEMMNLQGPLQVGIRHPTVPAS